MTYSFLVIKEKVKGQIFGSTGVKQVKMLQFAGNGLKMLILYTIQIQNSLLYVACFGNMGLCSEKASVHWLTIFAG